MIKYNEPVALATKPVLAYHKVENVLLYSAFIVQKYIDHGKLSNKVDSVSGIIFQYKPTYHIYRLHSFTDPNEYDLEHPMPKTVLAKNVCIG